MTIFKTLCQEADELIYRQAFACQYLDENSGEPATEDLDVVYMEIDLQVHRLKRIADNVIFYISPSDRNSNFRYGVVKTVGQNGLGYKNGRADKPLLYKEIRKYFIQQYNAIETIGYEADDGLGMHYKGAKPCAYTILSHIDKDISMIPGWHYDYVNEEIYYIAEGLGRLELNHKGKLRKGGLKFFYAQLLMGDRTDNIPGIKGLGDKKSFKLLDELQTEEECVKVVSECYKKQYGENWKEVILEIADLVWIVRADKLTGSEYLSDKLEM